MIKLSKLVKEIILADAEYFSKNHFVSEGVLSKVKKWLGDQQDKETQLMIADWLDSDAVYFKRLAVALCSHHWYIYPFMWIMIKMVPKRLREYVNELRDDASQR